MIDYDVSKNVHTLEGARRVLSAWLKIEPLPLSVLDVGSGRGTWLRAFYDLGVQDIKGMDGVAVDPALLFCAPEFIQHQDLNDDWNLGRKFDLVVCLEVAEHLHESTAEKFIKTLCVHADKVLFSAAPPGQQGQHHINCQWPEYWQALFNKMGFVCDDSIRWRIWNDEGIEPWYCQNIFVARRDVDLAGKEPRMAAVVHPRLLEKPNVDQYFTETVRNVEEGVMPVSWYLAVPVNALLSKLTRRLLKNKPPL